MSYKKMHGVVALVTVRAVAHELLRAATAALPNIKFNYYYCHFNIIYLFILFKHVRIYSLHLRIPSHRNRVEFDKHWNAS